MLVTIDIPDSVIRRLALNYTNQTIEDAILARICVGDMGHEVEMKDGKRVLSRKEILQLADDIAQHMNTTPKFVWTTMDCMNVIGVDSEKIHPNSRKSVGNAVRKLTKTMTDVKSFSNDGAHIIYSKG